MVKQGTFLLKSLRKIGLAGTQRLSPQAAVGIFTKEKWNGDARANDCQSAEETGGNMTFYPTSICKVLNPEDVAGVAIGLRKGSVADAYLFTGGTEQKIIYLTGAHIGSCYPVSGAQAESFLIFEGIDFEIDGSSAFDPAKVHSPAGAMHVAGTAVGIMSTTFGTNRSQKDGAIAIGDGSPMPEDGPVVAFKAWRALKHVGDQSVTVFEFIAPAS